jgi:hypothetical protein
VWPESSNPDLDFLLDQVARSLQLSKAQYQLGVPLRGSLPLLILICLLSSLCFASLGLLIASRAQTIEGASGLMNLAMLPMWIFSGVFFSSSRFPDTIQPFIQALPLTAVIDALRANVLRGAGLTAVAPELAIILGWMALSFILALKLFRWRQRFPRLITQELAMIYNSCSRSQASRPSCIARPFPNTPAWLRLAKRSRSRRSDVTAQNLPFHSPPSPLRSP